jgi:ATP phosphoribosyltransferase regulatory subunit
LFVLSFAGPGVCCAAASRLDGSVVTPAEVLAFYQAYVGAGRPSEVRAALIEDASAKPIAATEAALLYDLLGLQAPAEAALDHLRGITPLLPAIAGAVDRFATRLAALKARGVNTGALPFEASLGRTTMEYYDGFTFAFVGPADLPPVASGGRYDALTAVLGQGRSIPAVGGVIRPGLVAALRAAP